MNLFRRSIELVVIRDIFNPQNNIETYTGYDVEQLLKQAFGGQGLSSSVRLYHGDLLDEVTPKTPADVDKIMRLNGRIYAVVKPMGVGAYIAFLVVSTLVSLAVAFLMPIPDLGSIGNQPPSPNNALASRTNSQRLGGRVPDIYGQVWSVPDLIAPTYSAYIDNREIEFSYMCVGRGRFNVTQALDDTTPINQVFGSSVMVFDPDDSLNDTPDFLFGSALTPDEAALSRLTVKRYTSVNGQIMPPKDNYLTLDKAVFRAGGIIEQSGFNFVSQFSLGDALTIVQTNPTESANGIDDGETPPVVIKYSLSGAYVISAISETTITLDSPSAVNTDWQLLADNADYTVETEATISTQREAQWQGWFYTASKDHDRALINIRAPSGLYIAGRNKFEPIGLDFEIESEIVDVTNNPIEGTLERVTRTIYGAKYHEYATNGGAGTFRDGNHWWSGARVTDDGVAQSAGATFEVPNTHMEVGKRLRFRVRRKHNRKEPKNEYTTVQEIRIADFYGARLMTADDAPLGVTTVYTKTLATEGALSLKERKLRLLVQKYVIDATTGTAVLSNRADDIIRDIATDPKIGSLQLSQINIMQIKDEIDAQIAYFGTDKCSQFCYTFDDNNLSAEETLQTVSKAVFGQAKRQGNKIMLDFERLVPGSAAIFNSHNILPDTFTSAQSLGISNDWDGVEVEYVDPVDDAIVTITYPSDALTNPHKDKLIGVRNKVQAHMHMMRMYNKDRYAYKTCDFVAGDESNIVVRTNRITVADQLRADVQQGSVDSIEVIGSDIVLHTTDPVSIEPSDAYTLFIQTINNGVEAIAVTARDDYSVILSRLPSGEISGADNVVQAVYQIVNDSDGDRDAYLVAQKEPSEGMTNKLLCTNYDDRYYSNDTDFANGLIT